MISIAVEKIRKPSAPIFDSFGYSRNRVAMYFGGPGSGPHKGGGHAATKPTSQSRPAAKAPAISLRKTARSDAEKQSAIRSARSKASHNPATKAKQDVSEQVEHQVASALGATKSKDNLPMDVVIGGKHGVEVKVLHDAKDGRVNMRRDSRQRKEQWAKQTGGTVHTLLVDNRDVFDGGKHKGNYSGKKYYIAKGVGAFRLAGMTAVKSLQEAKRFILGGKAA